MARSVAEIAALAAAVGCGGSPSAPPPQTVVEPAAIPIVEAWAHAMGGRQRLAKLEAVHTTGTLVRNGVAGRFEKWTTPRGVRLELVFDGFSELTVFDGTRGWFRDRVGEVRDLDGIELEGERASVFWSSHAPILTDRWPGEVRANPDGTITLAPRDVRRPYTVAFDPSTHLPRTMRKPVQDSEVISTLDDYRDVDGVPFPFHDRVVLADIDVNWQTLAIDHAPPPPFERPVERPAPRLAAPVVVPYEPIRDGVPLVRVSIDGKPLELAVSSGYTFLNQARRDAIAPNAPGEREIAHLTLAIGELTFRDHVVDTKPFPNVESYFSRSLDGTLGYDVLSLFVVEIDPTTNTIAFHDRETYRHGNRGTLLPITLESGIPSTDAAVEVPGKPPVWGRFAIDASCACDVTMNAPFVSIHNLLDGLDARTANDGPVRAMWAPITALRLGGLRIAHPEGVFGLPHLASLQDPESAGLIGSRVLRRYRVVLDYHHKRIWLDPLVSAGSD